MTDMTAADLLERLRVKFSEPEWIVLSEVRNATGFRRTPRSADALAFSTYPSRGLALYGFEFKVSRSDWLRELKDPDKSVDMQKKCDRWYVVVPDLKLVQPGELPEAWGLMYAYRDTLRVHRESPQLHAGGTPPWPRDFVASIVRNALATGSVRDQAEARTAYDRGVKAGIAQQQSSDRYSRDEFTRLSENVRKFNAASGLHIDEYMTDRCVQDAAAKVKAAQAIGLAQAVVVAEDMAGRLERAAAALREGAAAAKAPPPGAPLADLVNTEVVHGPA
jgi:hypothetical protein